MHTLATEQGIFQCYCFNVHGAVFFQRCQFSYLPGINLFSSHLVQVDTNAQDILLHGRNVNTSHSNPRDKLSILNMKLKNKVIFCMYCTVFPYFLSLHSFVVYLICTLLHYCCVWLTFIKL